MPHQQPQHSFSIASILERPCYSAEETFNAASDSSHSPSPRETVVDYFGPLSSTVSEEAPSTSSPHKITQIGESPSNARLDEQIIIMIPHLRSCYPGRDLLIRSCHIFGFSSFIFGEGIHRRDSKRLNWPNSQVHGWLKQVTMLS